MTTYTRVRWWTLRDVRPIILVAFSHLGRYVTKKGRLSKKRGRREYYLPFGADNAYAQANPERCACLGLSHHARSCARMVCRKCGTRFEDAWPMPPILDNAPPLGWCITFRNRRNEQELYCVECAKECGVALVTWKDTSTIGIELTDAILQRIGGTLDPYRLTPQGWLEWSAAACTAAGVEYLLDNKPKRRRKPPKRRRRKAKASARPRTAESEGTRKRRKAKAKKAKAKRRAKVKAKKAKVKAKRKSKAKVKAKRKSK